MAGGASTASINGTNDTQALNAEPLRASRRQTSKEANEKIYRFVKQLRKPNTSDEDERFNGQLYSVDPTLFLIPFHDTINWPYGVRVQCT